MIKSNSILQEQLTRVEALLGETLLPVKLRDSWSNIPYEQIRDEFPVRCKIYREALLDEQPSFLTKMTSRPDVINRLALLNKLDAFIARHHITDNPLLRSEQIKVFIDLANHFEKGKNSGYIQLPTGSGKTVIFSAFISALECKTTVLVPTRLLRKQTENVISTLNPGLQVTSYQGRLSSLNADVVIMTYHSFANLIKNNFLKPDRIGILILDEAHEGLSASRIDLIKRLKDKIPIIGFTATPAYSVKKNLGQLLGTCIHKMTISEAVAHRAISPFSVIVAETTIDLSEVKIMRGEYNKKQLQRKIVSDSLTHSALDLYKKLFLGKRTIASCLTVAHGRSLAETFNNAGIKAEVLIGKDSSNKQKLILSQFRDGKIKVLFSPKLLRVGFNEPSVEVCLNIDPTFSKLKEEQRSGRALRIDPNNPGKHAYIVDFTFFDKRKHPPVIFSELVKGKWEDHPSYNLSTSQTGEAKADNNSGESIEIAGLRVYTSSSEVMRITNEYMLQRESIVGREIKWTRLKAKKLILNYAKELGHPNKLSKKEIFEGNKKGLIPSWSWIGHNFDPRGERSTKAGLKALGIELLSSYSINISRRWPKDEGRQALIAYAQELGKVKLDRKDLLNGLHLGKCPGRNWIIEHLSPQGKKSLSAALATLNLKCAGKKVLWTKHEAIFALKEYASKIGKSKLNYSDVRKGSAEGLCPSTKWIIQRLGNGTSFKDGIKVVFGK